MIVDANVLLYATEATAPHHEVARRWLEEALNGPSRVGLPWASLLAFQRIATHPRVSERPLGTAEAWQMVERWIAAPSAWIPVPGPRHQEILGRLLTSTNARGNLVPDAHLAALAIENGVGVCSFDSDFARFPQAGWFAPA